MQARLVPLRATLRQHIRTVRDLAASQGKQARLVIEGEDVEVDTSVIEHVRDPLTHMVRNAVDHGIEAPEERRRRGKDPAAPSPCARVTSRGRSSSRSPTTGPASTASASSSGPATAASTRRAWTRGRSSAWCSSRASRPRNGHGSLRPRRRPGRGASQHPRPPRVGRHSQPRRRGHHHRRPPALTLAIIEGSGSRWGTRRTSSRWKRWRSASSCPGGLGGRGRARRDQPARSRPALREAAPAVRSRRRGPPRARGRGAEGRRCPGGLVVDDLHGESQTVIKPLGRIFRGLPGIAGSAILGSGAWPSSSTYPPCSPGP
jgi:two-component system chemotaxis sensor kinase CheA